MLARLSRRLCLLAGAALALSGCSGDSRCPRLPGGPVYCLQPTDSVPTFHTLQDIRIRRGALDERMIAQLEVDGTSMRLAGLTPMGQRVFDTRFDNREATSDSIAGDRFDPRVLLALVQLGVWPLERISAGLDRTVRIEDMPRMRRFTQDDTVFLEIARDGSPPRYGHLEIRIPSADLTVTIENIDDDD